SKSELEVISKAAKILPKRVQASKDLKTLSEKQLFREFAMVMDDDLATPKALGMLVKLAREIVERRSAFAEKEQIQDPAPIFWHMVETLGFSLA
ncbi:MAG: DALR domain-containing protein, partial [Nitrososphaerales archaeon]